MAKRSCFWKLVGIAAAPQVALIGLLLAVGLGSHTSLFNVVMGFYAPVAYTWGALMKAAGTNSWAAIGLFVIGVPIVGTFLYSLAFAFVWQWANGGRAAANDG